MPLCYWATQTTAATALLENGTSGSTFRTYLTPISAAVRIQQTYQRYSSRTRAAVCIQNAYRASVVSYARNVLPLLRNPSRAIYSGNASNMTSHYKENLSRMYRAWADRPFSELLVYLHHLWDVGPDKFPLLPGERCSAEYERARYAQSSLKQEFYEIRGSYANW